MPLTRKQKAALIDELSEKLEGSSIVYMADFSGLDVTQSNALRGRFYEAGVEFKVFKNTLARLAMERVGGFDELKEHLSGPTALAFSEEPAAPARAIKNFLDEEDAERPQLKAAYIDGALYGAGDLNALAALKSRDELLGDILALLQAPMANIVGALQAPGATLAGAVKSIAEREEA